MWASWGLMYWCTAVTTPTYSGGLGGEKKNWGRRYISVSHILYSNTSSVPPSHHGKVRLINPRWLSPTHKKILNRNVSLSSPHYNTYPIHNITQQKKLFYNINLYIYIGCVFSCCDIIFFKTIKSRNESSKAKRWLFSPKPQRIRWKHSQPPFRLLFFSFCFHEYVSLLFCLALREGRSGGEFSVII